jgi:hypothetical protein
MRGVSHCVARHEFEECNIPLDADQEDELALSGDVEGAILLGSASKADLLTLTIAVLLDVLLSTLEDDTTLLLVGLWKLSAWSR